MEVHWLTYNPVVLPTVAADAVASSIDGCGAQQVHGQSAAQAGHTLPSLLHICCQECCHTVWQEINVFMY